MVGITIIVKKVETNRPDINVTAIGVKNELPDNARGRSPIIVVIVLSMIGLNLLLREDMQESITVSPSLIALLICSSNNMALLTTIPIRLANPRPAVKEKGCLNIYRPAIEPMIDNGIVSNIIRVCLEDLN